MSVEKRHIYPRLSATGLSVYCYSFFGNLFKIYFTHPFRVDRFTFYIPFIEASRKEASSAMKNRIFGRFGTVVSPSFFEQPCMANKKIKARKSRTNFLRLPS